MLVLCTQCHAQYEFDAALVPTAGYDAQCTHCGAVFFVANPSGPSIASSTTRVAMGDILGEPDRNSVVMFAKDVPPRKRWLLIAGSILALFLVSLVATYFLAPRVFDSTIGRVGKRTIHPQALAHFETAYQFMLQDTPARYDDARAELKKALSYDKRYPEALALLAMCYTFTGEDLETQAQIMQSQPLKEASVQMMREADQVLKNASALYDKNPYVLESLAIYYLADPNGMAKAEAFLQQGVAAEGTEKVPRLWGAYAEGVMFQRKNDDARAIRSWDSALLQEPRAIRVRFLRAAASWRLDRKDEAIEDLETILAASPERSDAQALLDKLTAAPPPPAQDEVVSPPSPVVEKKVKSKAKNKNKNKKKLRARGR